MKKIEQIKYVVYNSSYVKINREKLDEFVNNITDISYEHWYDNNVLNLDEKHRILLVFVLESMNFCFWQKPKFFIDYHGKKLKGSEALFYSVIKEIEVNKDFLEINYLKNLTEDEFKKIFATNYEGKLSLIDTRYKLLKDTVNVISNKQNKFYEELFNIKSDIEMVNYIKDNFKYFRDISKYKEIEIHFDKRVTLLVNDLLHISDTIRNNMKNVDNLTGCADYVIPKVLREYGVLEYNNDLASMIDNETEIEHDSEMEIEIRANMLYVVELVKEKLAERNLLINSVELDNIIWKTGRQKEIKRPPHHTTTIFY